MIFAALRAIKAAAWRNWQEGKPATVDFAYKLYHNCHELVRRADVEKVVTEYVESQQASAGDALRKGAMAEREAAIAYLERLAEDLQHLANGEHSSPVLKTVADSLRVGRHRITPEDEERQLLFPIYHRSCGELAFRVSRIPTPGALVSAGEAFHLDGSPQTPGIPIICDACKKPGGLFTTSNPAEPAPNPASESAVNG